MEKPELVIESQPDDDFVQGVCSMCPRVRFHLTGNGLEQKTLVRRMFDNHFRKFHMQEDASEAKDSSK